MCKRQTCKRCWRGTSLIAYLSLRDGWQPETRALFVVHWWFPVTLTASCWCHSFFSWWRRWKWNTSKQQLFISHLHTICCSSWLCPGLWSKFIYQTLRKLHSSGRRRTVKYWWVRAWLPFVMLRATNLCGRGSSTKWKYVSLSIFCKEELLMLMMCSLGNRIFLWYKRTETIIQWKWHVCEYTCISTAPVAYGKAIV